MRHLVSEDCELVRARQVAVDEQPSHFEEGALRRQLLDRIPAVAQDAFLAVDERDIALAGACVSEARVERDEPRGRPELPDIQCEFPFRTFNEVKRDRAVTQG